MDYSSHLATTHYAVTRLVLLWQYTASFILILFNLNKIPAMSTSAEPTNQTVAEVSYVLDMSPSQAWSIMQDLSVAHHYVPNIIDTEIMTEQLQGVGASRRVYQKTDKWLDETVIEWQEGKGFIIRLHQGEQGAPAPFSEATFRYHIDTVDNNDNQCEVTIGLTYSPRWGGFGALLNKLALASGIRAHTKKIAGKMKQYYLSS